MSSSGNDNLDEQWRNAIARDDLRDERRQARQAATANATGDRTMKVEFYYGKDSCDRAKRANTEDVAAVAIYSTPDGNYSLDVNRFGTSTEITNAVMAAIYAKWQTQNEVNMKPRVYNRPRAMRRTSLSQHSGSYMIFHVTIPEGTLEDWKEFLTDLLTKPESWVIAPEVTMPVDYRRMREARDKKTEAKLQRELKEQLFEAGYRALAIKLHPDRGGSTEDMTRLNEVRASLKLEGSK